MSHRFRFHVESERLQSGLVELTGTEAHHAAHVARIQKGETVELFDGKGRAAIATADSVDRKTVHFRTHEVSFSERPVPDIALLVGATKRSKVIEAILTASVPFEPTTIAFFSADRSNRAIEIGDKWARWAIEAAKQCGSSWIPEFATYQSLDAALDRYGDAKILTADTDTNQVLEVSNSVKDLLVIIGPEGGFSEDESGLLNTRAAQRFTLGKNVLRSELAAPVALSMVRMQSRHRNG